MSWLSESWLPKHPVDTILMAGQWTSKDLTDLTRAIAVLRPFAKDIVVVGPVPRYASSLPRLLVQELNRADQSPLVKRALKSTFELDRQMEGIIRGTAAHYFSVTGALCKTEQCVVASHS